MFGHDQAFVLMTALPPTLGHAALIRYAAHIGQAAHIILAIQPDEPFREERIKAISEHIYDYNFHMNSRRVFFHLIDRTLPQEPTKESEQEFWDMWAGFLRDFGARPGDAIVSSESYGYHLAEAIDGVFYPYDMDRAIVKTKATVIREDMLWHWDEMMPEFANQLQKRVTIFGAESTGKSTVAKDIRWTYSDTPTPEWARQYLEVPEVGPDVTEAKLHAIWHGQAAYHRYAEYVWELASGPVIVHDTDLFTTIGYWRLNKSLPGPPTNLIEEAKELKSDLYIITPSNIPFVPDPLRYGEFERETDDLYWVDLCEEFGLNYVVLKSDDKEARNVESNALIEELFDKEAKMMQYQRKGAEYGT